jgi:hypothetical protein
MGVTSTDADQVLVRAWFTKHWNGVVVCPVCKTNNWSYSSHVVQMYRFAPDAHVPGTLVYPYLPVYCTTCSHTMFFGTAAMGLQPPSPPYQVGGLAPHPLSFLTPPKVGG